LQKAFAAPCIAGIGLSMTFHVEESLMQRTNFPPCQEWRRRLKDSLAMDTKLGYGSKAGLWFEDMNFGLLWHSPGPGAVRIATCSAEYVAPSWSWASVDFSAIEPRRPWYVFNELEIYHSNIIWYPPTNHAAKALNGETKFVGQDPFSQVTSGLLRIKGPIHSICSCHIPCSFFDCHNSEVPFISYDVFTEGKGLEDDFNVELISKQRCDWSCSQPHRWLYYLHITSSMWPHCYFKPEHYKHDIAYSLILEASGVGRNNYQRVGRLMLRETVKTSAI
jgi:hypothetical protein